MGKASHNLFKIQEHTMSVGLAFDKYNPAEIFLMIDNQSVSRTEGERLIKRYGDLRAFEAVMEYQRNNGLVTDKEIEQKIMLIGELIDELFEKTEAAIKTINPLKKRERAKRGR
jgi:hypothetical protein